MSLTRLFVYGTLKRGQTRGSVLARQRFLGEARTVPRYRLYDCGRYPALVEATPGVCVEGEVWAVDRDTLSTIDIIEGVDTGLYVRKRVILVPPFADVEVHAYFYLGRTHGLRECGSRWP